MHTFLSVKTDSFYKTTNKTQKIIFMALSRFSWITFNVKSNIENIDLENINHNFYKVYSALT